LRHLSTTSHNGFQYILPKWVSGLMPSLPDFLSRTKTAFLSWMKKQVIGRLGVKRLLTIRQWVILENLKTYRVQPFSCFRISQNLLPESSFLLMEATVPLVVFNFPK